MLRKSAFVIASLALAAARSALPAYANNSSAELATGGLVFVTNDDIEMRAEDLFISTQQVRVRYRFFNKSNKNVTVLVAFPLPEVRISEPDQNIALPTENPVNIFAFTTRVNGSPVSTKVEQRATAVGIDRTQYLRELGIPLAPQLATTGAALDRLPADRWDEILRLGIAEVEEYDAGQGMKKHLAPRWGLNTTFYWEQTFPAGKETLIEHQYKPSVGGSAQTDLGAPSMSRRAGTATICADIASIRTSSPRSIDCARPTRASSVRPTANSASTTSLRPEPTGRAQSRIFILSSTKAIPTTS